MTLREAQARYLPALEATLRDILASPRAEFKPFYGMQQYHQGWLDERLAPIAADPGKRVRPLLCLLAHLACGGDPMRALPLAAAVELEHSFSLVHDDIQDESPLRRHRPTVWSIWGKPQAINVGDAIFAAAHAALLRLRQYFPADLVLRLAVAFEETCLRLCEGQYLDMAFEGEDDVSRQRYLLMIRGKTAALISYASWAGAALAGADEERAECFRRAGLDLGMAFQIQDDVLGIWGDEQLTGKSASSDIATAKKALPLLLALERLPADGAAELRAVYAQGARDAAAIVRARRLIEQSGAREECAALVDGHHEAALQWLRRAEPAEEAAAALEELIGHLSGRRH